MEKPDNPFIIKIFINYNNLDYYLDLDRNSSLSTLISTVCNKLNIKKNNVKIYNKGAELLSNLKINSISYLIQDGKIKLDVKDAKIKNEIYCKKCSNFLEVYLDLRAQIVMTECKNVDCSEIKKFKNVYNYEDFYNILKNIYTEKERNLIFNNKKSKKNNDKINKIFKAHENNKLTIKKVFDKLNLLFKKYNNDKGILRTLNLFKIIIDKINLELSIKDYLIFNSKNNINLKNNLFEKQLLYNNLFEKVISDNKNDDKTISNIYTIINEYKSDKITNYGITYRNNINSVLVIEEFILENNNDSITKIISLNKKIHFFYKFNNKTFEIEVKFFDLLYKNFRNTYFLNDDYINTNYPNLHFVGQTDNEIVTLDYNMAQNSYIRQIILNEVYYIRDIKFINDYKKFAFICDYNNHYNDGSKKAICGLFLAENIFENILDCKLLFEIDLFNLDLHLKNSGLENIPDYKVKMILMPGKIIFNTYKKLFIYDYINKTDKIFIYDNKENPQATSLNIIYPKQVNSNILLNLMYELPNHSFYLYLYSMEKMELIYKIVIFDGDDYSILRIKILDIFILENFIEVKFFLLSNDHKKRNLNYKVELSKNSTICKIKKEIEIEEEI